MNWRGDEAKKHAHKGAVSGLWRAAEHVLEESRRLVPVEEGTLLRSGFVSVDAANLRAAISYNTPYAIRQHEEMDWHHDDGQQAKYLEQPIDDQAVKNACRGLIGSEISKAL